MTNEPEEYWSEKNISRMQRGREPRTHGNKGALTRGRNVEGVVHTVEMRMQVVAMPMFEEEMVLK